MFAVLLASDAYDYGYGPFGSRDEAESYLDVLLRANLDPADGWSVRVIELRSP